MPDETWPDSHVRREGSMISEREGQ